MGSVKPVLKLQVLKIFLRACDESKTDGASAFDAKPIFCEELALLFPQDLRNFRKVVRIIAALQGRRSDLPAIGRH
jgi:hypothetical protein